MLVGVETTNEEENQYFSILSASIGMQRAFIDFPHLWDLKDIFYRGWIFAGNMAKKYQSLNPFLIEAGFVAGYRFGGWKSMHMEPKKQKEMIDDFHRLSLEGEIEMAYSWFQDEIEDYMQLNNIRDVNGLLRQLDFKSWK